MGNYWKARGGVSRQEVFTLAETYILSLHSLFNKKVTKSLLNYWRTKLRR
jgi:hypothetical protein